MGFMFVFHFALLYSVLSLPQQTSNVTLPPGTRIRINSKQDVLPDITLETGVVTEPNCDYQIFKDDSSRAPITNAEVGEPVYHQIKCHPTDGGKAEYCLSVFNCSIVSDDRSMDYPIVDEMGCTLEPLLFESVEYVSDLEAGIRGQAIRFHGSAKVQLQCQTRLLLKGKGDCNLKRPRCITNEFFIGSALKVNTPPR